MDEYEYDLDYGYEPFEDDAATFEERCLAEDEALEREYEDEDDTLPPGDGFEDWRDDA